MEKEFTKEEYFEERIKTIFERKVKTEPSFDILDTKKSKKIK